MRKFIPVLMAVLLLFAVNAYGAHMGLWYNGEYHDYSADDIHLNINGKEIVTKEMPPIALMDRTLVPVREVFESIGGEVSWVQETGQVSIMYNDEEVLFTLNDRNIYKGRTRTTIPAGEPAPMIINDKTMVPIRVIADLLGFEVEWNEKNRTVYLYEDDDNSSSGSGGVISKISVEADGDAEYVYLTYDAPVKPTIARYSSPERVVMDFDGAQLVKSYMAVDFEDGDIINSVRCANHEDMARIVLDVQKQPNIRVYRSSDGIVIAATAAGSSYSTKIELDQSNDRSEPPKVSDDKPQSGSGEVELDTTDTVDISSSVELDYRTIVIDPGHGGYDPGAIGGDVNEKDVALAISLLVRDKLEDEGYNVVMTRSTDTYPSLQDRVNIAGKATDGKKIPALYVSIHCNSVDNNPGVNGTQVYYHPDSKYGTILAENIYNRNVVNTTLTPKQVHDGSGLFVIRKTLQPAALVETAFISNESDREYLTSEEGQEALATGIFEGIVQTMEQMKKDKGIK